MSDFTLSETNQTIAGEFRQSVGIVALPDNVGVRYDNTTKAGNRWIISVSGNQITEVPTDSARPAASYRALHDVLVKDFRGVADPSVELPPPAKPLRDIDKSWHTQVGANGAPLISTYG